MYYIQDHFIEFTESSLGWIYLKVDHSGYFSLNIFKIEWNHNFFCVDISRIKNGKWKLFLLLVIAIILYFFFLLQLIPLSKVA